MISARYRIFKPGSAGLFLLVEKNCRLLWMIAAKFFNIHSTSAEYAGSFDPMLLR